MRHPAKISKSKYSGFQAFEFSIKNKNVLWKEDTLYKNFHLVEKKQFSVKIFFQGTYQSVLISEVLDQVTSLQIQKSYLPPWEFESHQNQAFYNGTEVK